MALLRSVRDARQKFLRHWSFIATVGLRRHSRPPPAVSNGRCKGRLKWGRQNAFPLEPRRPKRPRNRPCCYLCATYGKGLSRLTAPHTPKSLAPPGAARGTRTPDLLITNQLLYQLSYGGAAAFHTRRRRLRQEPFCGAGGVWRAAIPHPPALTRRGPVPACVQTDDETFVTPPFEKLR